MDKKIKITVFTISTRCSRGESEDQSGPLLCELAKKYLGEIIKYKIIDDNQAEIREALIEAADNLKSDIVFTTGGTGFSPSDVTPEATEAVIEKKAPGISEYIRMKSFEKTDRAMLSRSLAGIRGKTLIINMPGSAKAVEECFYFIEKTLPHAVEVLSGETLNCGR